MSGLKQQSSRAAKQPAAKQESRASKQQSSRVANQQSSKAAGEQQSRKAPTNNTNTNPLNEPQTIKATAANHEKTCEEPHRYQKTSKKQKGTGRKKDFPPPNQKSYKNRPKMKPGRPKMEPGCTKSGTKLERTVLNHPKWLQDGSQNHLTGKRS